MRELLSGRRGLAWIGVVVAVLVLAGLVVWWLDGDDDADVQEEIGAVAGVTSVEQASRGTYEVSFGTDLTAERLGEALRQISAALTADPAAEPPLVARASVGPVEFDIMPAADHDRTAAVVTSIAAAGPVSAEVQPAVDDRSTVTVASREDVVPVAQAIMAGFVRAGVDGFEDGPLEVWEQGGEAPTLRVATSTSGIAQRLLATLAQSLERTGGELLDADLDDDDQSVSVELAERSQMTRVRQILLDAFGSQDLSLSMESGGLRVFGNSDPTAALALVRRLERVGAEVETVAAARSNITLSVTSLREFEGVVDLTRDARAWTLDPGGRVIINGSGREFPTWFEGNDVTRLQQMLPGMARVQRAGYDVTYVFDSDLDADDPEHQALGVAPSVDQGGNAATDTDVDTATGREALIRVLRTGRWPGELHLEVSGFEFAGSLLAFWTTPTGSAREVVEPVAQHSDFTPEAARQFVQEWNNTAK